MRGAGLAMVLVACAHAQPLAIQGADGNVPLTTLDGRDIKLADVGRPVTVIALWGTFCEPCLEELPLVNQLAETYRNDSDVVVLAVAIDGVEDIEKVRATAKRLKLTMPVLIDRDGALSRRLQPREDQQVLPLFAVIGRDFKVDRSLGFVPMGASQFVQKNSERIERARRGQLTKR